MFLTQVVLEKSNWDSNTDSFNEKNQTMFLTQMVLEKVIIVDVCLNAYQSTHFTIKGFKHAHLYIE